MYRTLRKLLFRLEPEQAHTLTLGLMRLVGALPPLSWALRQLFSPPALPVQAFGLHFLNPIGLAAGYDKDGLGWRGLASLGFGHIEIGTVTPRGQAGNPQPRLFRLPEQGALINRMGFPGQGAEAVARRLRGKRPADLILGVNLGKNKDTPLEEAAQDYLDLLRIFAPLADYLVINVSSPNTVGLRRLQGREALDALLGALMRQRRQLNGKAAEIPLLVKVAPDLSDEELEDVLQVVSDHGVNGLVATNTTLSRPGLEGPLAGESGGLSGAPLFALSQRMVAEIVRRTQGRLPVIGVGGVMGPAEARAMLAAGASLVQVYTGLVYGGPGLVRQIVTALKANPD